MQSCKTNSWEYIEPVINEITGKSKSIKSEKYNELNDLDKAIFSFYVYYNHAKISDNHFKLYTRFFIDSNNFINIINGVKYFENTQFIHLLTTINETFKYSLNIKNDNVYNDFLKEALSHIEIMNTVIESNNI